MTVLATVKTPAVLIAPMIKRSAYDCLQDGRVSTSVAPRLISFSKPVDWSPVFSGPCEISLTVHAGEYAAKTTGCHSNHAASIHRHFIGAHAHAHITAISHLPTYIGYFSTMTVMQIRSTQPSVYKNISSRNQTTCRTRYINRMQFNIARSRLSGEKEWPLKESKSDVHRDAVET